MQAYNIRPRNKRELAFKMELGWEAALYTRRLIQSVSIARVSRPVPILASIESFQTGKAETRGVSLRGNPGATANVSLDWAWHIQTYE